MVADIGGTHSRFARVGPDSSLAGQVRYRNAEFSGLIAAVQAATRQPGPPLGALALAVACPVVGGPIRLTNLDWTFDATSVRQAVGASRIRIVNDFAAAAAGLLGLGDADVKVVERPGRQGDEATRPDAVARIDDRAAGVRVVLGPGTGLGLSALVRCGSVWRVLESEAGHMGCATTHADAQPALAQARDLWGRVSWERLLCGDGLARLDAALRAAPARSPAEVAADALAGEPTSVRAARVFSHLLGEFAGDACLMLRADQVYLTGGVLDGLGTAFDAQAFRAGFEDKGRFADMLRKVAVMQVCADDLALRGLANVIAGTVQAPGVTDPAETRGLPGAIDRTASDRPAHDASGS